MQAACWSLLNSVSCEHMEKRKEQSQAHCSIHRKRNSGIRKQVNSSDVLRLKSLVKGKETGSLEAALS